MILRQHQANRAHFKGQSGVKRGRNFGINAILCLTVFAICLLYGYFSFQVYRDTENSQRLVLEPAPGNSKSLEQSTDSAGHAEHAAKEAENREPGALRYKDDGPKGPVRISAARTEPPLKELKLRGSGSAETSKDKAENYCTELQLSSGLLEGHTGAGPNAPAQLPDFLQHNHSVVGTVDGDAFVWYQVCIAKHQHDHNVHFEASTDDGQVELFISPTNPFPRPWSSSWIARFSKGKAEVTIPTFHYEFPPHGQTLYVGVHGVSKANFQLLVAIFDIEETANTKELREYHKILRMEMATEKRKQGRTRRRNSDR